MSKLYTPAHRALQQKFGSEQLADVVEASVMREELSTDHTAFISAQRLFFLSSMDEQQRPTVSYKGGEQGFVRAINPHTLIFPSYDGNGMFYSMGNISAHPEVGLLFIDFETPNRLRIQGQAELLDKGALLDSYPGADLVVKVAISQVWVNCSRYIHQMKMEMHSPYIPAADGHSPVALWKRIEGMANFLSTTDQEAVMAVGQISAEEYARRLAEGEVS